MLVLTMEKTSNIKRQSSIRKILVRCPNWVGDVVMAVPAFECIRRNFPDAHITASIRKYARGVIEDGPWFDEIVNSDDKSYSGFFKTIGHVRKLRPDLAILFPNSARSTLPVFFGGAKKIVGYKRGFRSLLLNAGPRPKTEGGRITPAPMSDYYIEICRSLGLDLPASMKPKLYMSKLLEEKGAGYLKGKGVAKDDLVVGLNPGAKFGSSKCWPPEYFAELAELLQDRLKCKILLLAGPGEDSIVKAIIGKSKADIINTAPDKVDLALLKPLVKRCNLLVTNDTGPRHYAVAFDVPVVVLMGPTDPRYTAANLDRTVVIRQELECSPCHDKACLLGHHRCMRDIRPDKVLQEALGLIHL